MARSQNTRCLMVAMLALAALMLLTAGSCGKRGGEDRLSAADTLPQAKSASIPPQGTTNQPWLVDGQQSGNQLAVSWRGHNIGDYDLDGTVGVADITPIAMNFGASVQYAGSVPVETGNNEYLACVDGDGNGSIGVADITPIAQHFGVNCAGYRVYLGLRATGETGITWNPEFETPPGNPVSPVTVPFSASRNMSEVQRYSFSFTAPASFEGFGVIRVVATDGTEEGAFTETGEFTINTVSGDTTPPYNTGGIAGLLAAAKPRRAILSWGTWEDAQSPPVDIEIAWSIPPLDPDTAVDRVVMDAAAQTYEIDSLTNDQAYEFACRFTDHAAIPNATAWQPTVSATPSAHLYALPPAGAEAISSSAGLSPSVDSFLSGVTAVRDAYAPVVAYISAGGGDVGQLIFARYDDGAWLTENVSTDTFGACSVHALLNSPVIVTARLTPTPNVTRFWSDDELNGWSSEVVYAGAASNLRTYRNEGDPEHPFAVFTTVGASPDIHVAYWDGSGWTLSTQTLGFADSILDLSLTIKGLSSLEVLVTHGTVDPQQAQIDSSIACLMWEISSHTWSLNGDYQLTNDGSGNARSAVSTTFWPETPAPPVFLGAAGAIRLVNQTIFTYNVDVPYGDLLGMEPSGFGSQPQWVEIKKGTTGINLMPLGLTLNWNVEPRWTEGADRIVFVNVAGTVTFTLNPFMITGGTLTPSWWTATNNGVSWTAQQLSIGGAVPSGRAQDMAAAPDADNFQMVYTQLDTIDLTSLLGGGALPTGDIYYAQSSF